MTEGAVIEIMYKNKGRKIVFLVFKTIMSFKSIYPEIKPTIIVR